MEIITGLGIVCAFGVYLTERLLLSKRLAVRIEAETKAQVEKLKEQVDNQRERLNRLEARR